MYVCMYVCMYVHACRAAMGCTGLASVSGTQKNLCRARVCASPGGCAAGGGSLWAKDDTQLLDGTALVVLVSVTQWELSREGRPP
jgi:hypothetical protein